MIAGVFVQTAAPFAEMHDSSDYETCVYKLHGPVNETINVEVAVGLNWEPVIANDLPNAVWASLQFSDTVRQIQLPGDKYRFIRTTTGAVATLDAKPGRKL